LLLGRAVQSSDCGRHQGMRVVLFDRSPLIQPARTRAGYSTFNDTQKDIPNTTLPELFAAQVEKTRMRSRLSLGMRRLVIVS